MSLREIFATASYYSCFVVTGLVVVLAGLYVAILIRRMRSGHSSGPSQGRTGGRIGPRD
jgi:hypothetical protein